MKLFRKVLLLLFTANLIIAQNKTVISGTVSGENGKPLPYVNVYLLQTLDGGMTNENGKFEFVTSLKGKAVIVASMVGYKKFQKEISLGKNRRVKLKITLRPSIVKLSEAIVTGSSFASEKGKGVVIKSLDVLTTPGGAADIYQSLKTMPGLTQVSESAELYVRGGDPSETVTLIDQAPVYHPYTLESAYGGLFSNLNTAAVGNMYFSSGGFSVKYGNVLSGVLDIETKNFPEARNFNVGLSMASAELNAELPLYSENLGFRIYAQQSFTKPIMWLNGSLDEFTTTPVSKNLSASLIYKYSGTGRLKLFGLFANDLQGVKVKRAEFNGAFNGNSRNTLINLQQTDIVFSDIVMKNDVSFSSFKNTWRIGILDLTKYDDVFQIRSDLEKIFSPDTKVLAGFEFQQRKETYEGTVPAKDYDIRKESEGTILNELSTVTRLGIYAETDKLNLFGIKKLYGIAGLRSDYSPGSGFVTFDPRFATGYKLSENSTVKFGWGIFHQIQGSGLFTEKNINQRLLPMQATHYVISYDYNFSGNGSFRLEAYHKKYRNLPLENDAGEFTNDGYGFANGIDLIFKGELPFGINGWISYGFINTKRKWKDYKQITVSDFDITHNFSLVTKYNISAMWQLGINFKYATGKPYTPVVSAVYIKEYNIFKPIYAAKNSDRYPDYKRLDFRITHLNRLFDKYFAVFYVEMLNILNFNNLFGYSYNRDYTKKLKIKSYFGRRTIVFGTSISF